MIIKKDPGYQQYAHDYPWTSKIVFVLGTLFSFKLYKLFYTRFCGSDRFYASFHFPSKFHTVQNVLTVLNLLFVLLPIIGVDIYGLYKDRWGDYYYILMIETLVLSVTMIPLTVYEMVKVEKVVEPSETMFYSQVHDPSVNADQRVLEVLDQNIRRKFPGKTIADYINELKAQRGVTEDDDDDDERQYL